MLLGMGSALGCAVVSAPDGRGEPSVFALARGGQIAALRARLDHDTHVVEARIVTAQPADAAVLDALRALVAKRTKQSVRLVSAVDPALLGGFVVSVGSARLDASLERRLEKARAALHALAPA